MSTLYHKNAGDPNIMLSPKGSINDTEGLEYITQEEEGESVRAQDIEAVDLCIGESRGDQHTLPHFTGQHGAHIKPLSAIRQKQPPAGVDHTKGEGPSHQAAPSMQASIRKANSPSQPQFDDE